VVFGFFQSERAKKARQLEEALEALEALLLAEGEKRSSEKAKNAIVYWKLCRSDYEGLSEQNERYWKRLQATVIISGVVATFVGAVSPTGRSNT
jgi:hypothetical protein